MTPNEVPVDKKIVEVPAKGSTTNGEPLPAADPPIDPGFSDPPPAPPPNT